MSCRPNIDLRIYRGASYGPLRIRLHNHQNAPVDLSGWTVWAEVRTDAEASQVAANLAPQITDAPAGLVEISLTDEQTAALTVGSYRWDLLAENPSGERIGPLVSGAVTITKLITQPA